MVNFTSAAWVKPRHLRKFGAPSENARASTSHADGLHRTLVRTSSLSSRSGLPENAAFLSALAFRQHQAERTAARLRRLIVDRASHNPHVRLRDRKAQPKPS